MERSYIKRLKDEDFGNSKFGKLRKLCWNLTEYPETSLAARVNYNSLDYRNQIFFLDLCLHKYGCSHCLHSCVHLVHYA